MLSYLHQVSALALPIKPQTSPTITGPRLSLNGGHANGGNDVTVSQIVTSLLRELALRPDVRFRQAILVGVFLRVSPGDSPSNNINDFQSLGCAFLYGGPPPPRGKSNAFTIANQWPEHWEQWKNQVVPRVLPAGLEEIPWQKIQGLMSVKRADYLLKSAGYSQRYRGVVLLQLVNKPPAYCFSDVDDLRNVNVDISTGKVSEVRECTVSLEGRSVR